MYLEQTGYAPDWNFWKYLIDHRGNVIGPWGPQTSVDELVPVVKKAVAAAGAHDSDLNIFDDHSPSSHPNVIKEL